MCVYFGTNGYFHFLHFSHTSKRKNVYVCAAQIDNKMYKFKTETKVRVFFISFFLRVGVELVTLSGFCFVFNFLQLIIFMYVLFSFFAVCRRAYASFYSLFQSTHILLNY